MYTWTDWYCPKCKAQNLVDLGDMNDMTGVDIDAVKCHSCGHTDWIDPTASEYDQACNGGVARKPEDTAVEDGKAPCPHCEGTGVKRES